MEVAHAARRLFDVRLEMIDRAVIFRVARDRELTQMSHELLPVTAKELGQTLGELFVKRVIANEKALIEEADTQLDVRLLELATLCDCVYGLAEAKPVVP